MCVCVCVCVPVWVCEVQRLQNAVFRNTPCFHCSPIVRLMLMQLQEKQCRHRVYTVYIPGIPDIPSGRSNDV